MAEREYREYHKEPILPYETISSWEWFKTHDVDVEAYPGIDSLQDGLRFARLRSPEITAEILLREQIEVNLPLRGATRVNHPRLKPEFWGTEPKLFKAPAGMAFELTTSVDYDEDYQDEDGNQLAPTKTEVYSVIGEYLGIETRTEKGTAAASITVMEQAVAYAQPIYNDGNPDDNELIRLPSRADPEVDGAAVMFARLDGWEVVHGKSRSLSGEYGKSNVKLVPFERAAETERYVADFKRFNDFPLDDFILVDEAPLPPPGYFYYPTGFGEGTWVHNPTNLMTLPPGDLHGWMGDMWEKHGIMMKLNPTAINFIGGNSRFYYLHFDRGRSTLAWEIRYVNTYEHKHSMFMRALAIKGIANTSMDDVLKVALSKDQLEGKDRDFVK